MGWQGSCEMQGSKRPCARLLPIILFIRLKTNTFLLSIYKIKKFFGIKLSIYLKNLLYKSTDGSTSLRIPEFIYIYIIHKYIYIHTYIYGGVLGNRWYSRLNSGSVLTNQSLQWVVDYIYVYISCILYIIYNI